MLAGVNEKDLPHSLGYVMTEAKPTAQLLLAVETGDPLLAVGRYGLGAGMAYTSDLTERWGSEWLAWDGCGKFWVQAIRAVLRKSSVDGLRVETHRTNDGWELDVHRRGEDGLPINGIHWDASLLDEQGHSEPLPVQETGLGRYHAKVVAADKQHSTLRFAMPTMTKPRCSASSSPIRPNTNWRRRCLRPWRRCLKPTPRTSPATFPCSAAAIPSCISFTLPRCVVWSAASCSAAFEAEVTSVSLASQGCRKARERGANKNREFHRNSPLDIYWLASTIWAVDSNDHAEDMAMEPIPTDRELEALKVLWQQEEATVRDIMGRSTKAAASWHTPPC